MALKKPLYIRRVDIADKKMGEGSKVKFGCSRANGRAQSVYSSALWQAKDRGESKSNHWYVR